MVYPSGDNGFSVHGVKCPSCSGPLNLPPDADSVVCPYCGCTVYVSYGNERAQSGVEPDGTIRDRGTGYGLFRVCIAAGWQVSGTALQGTGSSSRPHIPQVELRNRFGSIVTLAMGDAGTRRSAGFSALMGMYGGHLTGVDHANYAEVPDPLTIADTAAYKAAARVGASSVSLARQLGCPDLEARKQRSFARFQRIAQVQGASVASPFMGVVLRVYECVSNGQPWRVASYVALSAAKDGMGLGDGFSGVAEGIGGLMEGIGGLFGGQAAQSANQGGISGSGAVGFIRGGGLIGKMKRDRMAAQQSQAAQQQQPQQVAPQQTPSAPVQQPATRTGWCSPDFADYVSAGTVYWSVDALVTFAAPAVDFDSQLEGMFLPLVDSLEVHPDIENLALQVAMQEAGQIGQATQTQLAQNQAAFQAQQAAHRQQQAAFDAYNQSISDARNARHQQFMASSHSQMGRTSPDYSEAIRGVNTYTTSDGREVELSVHADHAYENQAGDVIGTSRGFDPGADWTEINKRTP